MEYNNYFPAQPGIPPPGPPVMNNMQHGGSPAPMMHGPPPQHPHVPRQNVTPGPMIHHQPMQPQSQPPPNHHMSSPQLNQNASPSLMPMGGPNQPPQPPSAPPPQVGTPHTPHNFMSPSPMINHHPTYHQGVSPNQGPPPHPPHGPPRYNHGPPPPPMHVGPPQPQHHVPMPNIPMHPHGHPPPNYGHAPGPPQYPPMERNSPFYQSIPQTEFRIIELNKRLQSRPKPMGPPSPLPIGSSVEESIWWDRFAYDFFDDDATLTIRISPDDRPVEYTIGRPLIPRFFKSYFDGDVIDYSIKLRNSREIAHPHVITLECDQTDITTKNLFRHSAANMCVVVHSGGHLFIDFVSSYDNLLIKSWRFYTHRCQEYIDRSLTSHNIANAHLVEPITKHGLTSTTISYLKMCKIMEPMQDLMIRHRQTKMDPRACLRYLLNDKYKFKITEEVKPPPPKRRKRKAPAATGTTTNKRGKANANNIMNNNPNNNNNVNSNNIGFPNNIGNNISLMSPANHMGGHPDLSLASQDVMVVGEPSMLGSDFNDENERRITRLENNQFENTLNNDNGNCANDIDNFRNESSNNMNVNSNQEQLTNSNSMLQNPPPMHDQSETEHNHQIPSTNNSQSSTNNGDSILTNNGPMESIIDNGNGNSNNNLSNHLTPNSNSMLLNNMNVGDNEDGPIPTPTTTNTTPTTPCSTTTANSSLSTSLIMDAVSSNNNNPNMLNNNSMSSTPPNTSITLTATTSAGDNPTHAPQQTAEIAN